MLRQKKRAADGPDGGKGSIWAEPLTAALRGGKADTDHICGGMENKMKKTFSLLLTLCMLLGLMPMSAYAAESGTASGEVMSDIYTVIPEEGTLPDSDEILDSYAQQVMYPQYSISMFSLGPDRLGERQPSRVLPAAPASAAWS